MCLRLIIVVTRLQIQSIEGRLRNQLDPLVSLDCLLFLLTLIIIIFIVLITIVTVMLRLRLLLLLLLVVDHVGVI